VVLNYHGSYVTYWVFWFQCAESALKSVLGGLDNTYFVGNAPMAHMVAEQTGDSSASSFKVFFVLPHENNDNLCTSLSSLHFVRQHDAMPWYCLLIL
jgi:hypothetical protein